MSQLRDTSDELVAALESGAPTAEVIHLFERVADDLSEWCVTTPHGLSVKGIEGAPDWYGHETSSWRLCERIRGVTRSRYGRRIPEELCAPIERIVTMPEVGKGRQAWVHFAIDVGKGAAARRMAVHLRDDEVNSNVVAGLTRYRVPGFEAEVEHVAGASESPLFRRSAKRYLAKVAADTGRTTAG